MGGAESVDGVGGVQHLALILSTLVENKYFIPT